MAMFTPLSSGDDRLKLEEFINYFVAVIEEIINNQSGGADAVPSELLNGTLLPNELRSIFHEAWLVCRAREVPTLIQGIRTAPVERLQRYGLVGVELQAKLASVSKISEWLWGGPTRKLLKKLLEMIDTLLESIVEAIPGGHGLIELKQAIENLIPED